MGKSKAPQSDLAGNPNAKEETQAAIPDEP